jgi:general secretion pathway protein A
MYLDHYNLRETPFNISPDSRFFWVSEKHKEGLAAFKYAILEEKGFLLLTGEVGTGKTLLIKAFAKMSGVETLIATIPDPDLDIMDFFRLLAEEFKMNQVFSSKGEFLIQFKQFLLESYGSDKKVLLIIDEAQRLNNELLEQIRLLSNIEMDHKKLINIFFVGQIEFNQMLMEQENRAVRQRIAVNYELKPLTSSETTQYIRHRLMLAGALDDIFKPDAVREVSKLSRGYPRLINIICDYALVTGHSAGLKKIGAGLIKDCGKELQISIGIDKTQKEQPNPFQPVAAPAAAAARERPQTGIRYGFAFIVMLLFAFAGYQMYGSWRESPPLWEAEEFAPKKENWFSEEQSKALKAQIDKWKTSGQDLATAEITLQESPETDVALQESSEIQPVLHESDVKEVALQEEPETETAVEAPPDMKRDKNEELPDAENPEIDSAETQPTGLVADQKSIIYFKLNSNELPPKAYETLDSIVQLTSQRTDLEITVEGYTDSQGDPVYNRQLSKYRADMVKNYLIGHGIAPTNIIAVGRGPQNPLKSNTTFEGRKQNRRVEIQVKKIR